MSSKLWSYTYSYDYSYSHSYDYSDKISKFSNDNTLFFRAHIDQGMKNLKCCWIDYIWRKLAA